MSMVCKSLASVLFVMSAALMAQQQEVWIDIVINGKAVMGFAPAADRPTRRGGGVCSEVSETGARTTDGALIRALEFTGWREGDRYSVLVIAIVSAGGPASSTPCGEGTGFKRVEFESVRLKIGEEFIISKMKDAGMAPWMIRTGRKQVR